MEDDIAEELERIKARQDSIRFIVYKIMHIGTGIAIGWLIGKAGLAKVLGAIL